MTDMIAGAEIVTKERTGTGTAASRCASGKDGSLPVEAASSKQDVSGKPVQWRVYLPEHHCNVSRPPVWAIASWAARLLWSDRLGIDPERCDVGVVGDGS